VAIIAAAVAASCHLLPGNVEDLSYVLDFMASGFRNLHKPNWQIIIIPSICKKALYLPGYGFEQIGDMGWPSRVDGGLK
jgi:hypothetical protein